jgi:hypothetical protein
MEQRKIEGLNCRYFNHWSVKKRLKIHVSGYRATLNVFNIPKPSTGAGAAMQKNCGKILRSFVVSACPY